MENDEMTSIPFKLLQELLEDQKRLRKLEAAGVDNWDGYDWAMEDEDDNS